MFGGLQAINVSSVSFAGLRKNNVAFTLQPVTQRFAVLRAAKKETVEKVCDIVKKQLVLPEGTDVTGASKFTDLGADSLDTVSQLDAISSSISFNYLALTSTCPEIA
jgi:Zn-dependent metalloprotease